MLGQALGVEILRRGGAKGSDGVEKIEAMKTDGERLATAHGEPGDGAVVTVFLYTVFRLDEGEHVFE